MRTMTVMLTVGLLACGSAQVETETDGCSDGGGGSTSAEASSASSTSASSTSATTGAGGAGPELCPDGTYCNFDPQGAPHGACEAGFCEPYADEQLHCDTYDVATCAPGEVGYACSDYFSPFTGCSYEGGLPEAPGLGFFCCAY